MALTDKQNRFAEEYLIDLLRDNLDWESVNVS